MSAVIETATAAKRTIVIAYGPRRIPPRQPLRPTVAALFALAKAKRISHDNLAILTGYHRSTIYQIFSGRQMPSIAHVEDIANALKADLKVLGS